MFSGSGNYLTDCCSSLDSLAIATLIASDYVRITKLLNQLVVRNAQVGLQILVAVPDCQPLQKDDLDHGPNTWAGHHARARCNFDKELPNLRGSHPWLELL
jgi:hypothetical protein